MSQNALFLLGLKMAIAASIVVSVSVIAERSRPFVAAMVATLPVSAGPTLLFLALDHDAAFMRGTLTGAMVTNMATGVYCLAYAMVARRVSTIPALATALGAWALAGAVLRVFEWNLITATLGTIIAFGGSMLLARPFLSDAPTVAPPRDWFALPLRALAVAMLVATVTSLSWTLGPYLSGFLTVFPIVLSSLIAILHSRIGGEQTAALIANGLVGLLGFGLALGAAQLAIPAMGPIPALGLGLAVCVAWNGALVIRRQRQRMA